MDSERPRAPCREASSSTGRAGDAPVDAGGVARSAPCICRGEGSREPVADRTGPSRDGAASPRLFFWSLLGASLVDGGPTLWTSARDGSSEPSDTGEARIDSTDCFSP